MRKFQDKHAYMKQSCKSYPINPLLISAILVLASPILIYIARSINKYVLRFFFRLQYFGVRRSYTVDLRNVCLPTNSPHLEHISSKGATHS